MGIDIFLETKDRRASSEADESSPEVWYLRDSYSVFSFNKWATANLNNRTLFWIFGFDEDELKVVGTNDNGSERKGFFPDWSATRARAEESLALAQQLPADRFSILISYPSYALPESFPLPTEAFAIYGREKSKLDMIRSSNMYPTPMKNDLTYNVDQQKFGLYLGDGFRKRAAVVWCRTESNQPYPVLVAEVEKDYHEPYREMLKQILKFIATGEAAGGWTLWSY